MAMNELELMLNSYNAFQAFLASPDAILNPAAWR